MWNGQITPKERIKWKLKCWLYKQKPEFRLKVCSYLKRVAVKRRWEGLEWFCFDYIADAYDELYGMQNGGAW